jgi:hypothetical protein
MLADATGSIDEAYQGAVGSSNLRVGNDHTLPTPGDMVAAAGMNKHRTGLLLLRLRTEWGSAARPVKPSPEQITEHARKVPVEAPTLRIAVKLTADQIASARADHQLEKLKDVSWVSVLEIPNPHAGKVRVENHGKVEYQLPLKIARRERQAWYEQEIKLALMTMRTLPMLRDALLHYARAQELACDETVVAEVLLWWLDPKCTRCGGNKEEVVPGTGRTNGLICHGCKGSGMERQGDPPSGRKGVKLAGHINACLQAARQELREGSQRLRRTYAGEVARAEKPR